jgi:hypothetical protein
MASTIPFPRQAQAARARRSKAMLLPIPRASANELALQVHLALASLRAGGSDRDAQALLHAHVLATSMADAGYGTLTQEQVCEADAALLACYEQGRTGGGWRLEGAGFDALAAVVTVYDEQLQRAPLWVLTEASERLDRMGAAGAVEPAAMRKLA